MKHIVFTSGGIGSFITLCMVVEEHGAENVVSLFADTKIEDEDLYRFMFDIHAHVGVPMTIIADGRDPWQVFRDRKFIGNSRRDPCSENLKRKPMDLWLKQHYAPEDCVCYVGIDFNEKHRIERLAPLKLPYVFRAPMVEKEIMLWPEDKKKFCDDRGIKVPRLYGMGMGHNNCGGFCVKAGLGQFALLYQHLPQRYRMHELEERVSMARNPKLRPFLVKVTGGVKRYLTLREYRLEFLEPKKLTDDDRMDHGGCGCALE